MNQQSFYIAIALYESTSSDSEKSQLYEECTILIKAASLEQAREKTLKYAKHQEISYRNVYQDIITWSLKHIIDVTLVLDDNFDDGTELYTRHFRNYQAYYTFEPFLSSEQL